jgi:hypothetical protein
LGRFDRLLQLTSSGKKSVFPCKCRNQASAGSSVNTGILITRNFRAAHVVNGC